MAVVAPTATKVAVVGAGLAGLASCWHLLQCGAKVTLYDQRGIAGGASGVAAGLLHSYMGIDAKEAWSAKEALPASHELLSIAEAALGRSVASRKGILRIAIEERQKLSYAVTAKRFDDVEWLNHDQVQALAPGVSHSPGIFVRSGSAVDTQAYLHALWQACAIQGATLCKEQVDPSELTQTFDHVLLAVGSHYDQCQALSKLPLRKIKGQLLTLCWPSHRPPLQLPINSKAYILAGTQKGTCLAGATYERTFTSAAPCLESAEKQLMPKISSLVPDLKDAKVLKIQAGVRVATPNHLPLVGQLSDKMWVFTGLGSKGLLYHAWLGKLLAQAVVTAAPSLLPKEVSPP